MNTCLLQNGRRCLDRWVWGSGICGYPRTAGQPAVFGLAVVRMSDFRLWSKGKGVGEVAHRWNGRQKQIIGPTTISDMGSKVPRCDSSLTARLKRSIG